MSIFRKLDFIMNTLHSKGYDNYILSTWESSVKAKGLIDEYRQKQHGNIADPVPGVWCSTCIKCDGEDKSSVLCDMWMCMQQDDLVVKKMVIENKDWHNQLLKSKTLTDISIQNIPTATEALVMVYDKPKIIPKTANRNRPRL